MLSLIKIIEINLNYNGEYEGEMEGEEEVQEENMEEAQNDVEGEEMEANQEKWQNLNKRYKAPVHHYRYVPTPQYLTIQSQI